MEKLIKITLKIIIISLLCTLSLTIIGCKNINELIQNLSSDNDKIRISAIDDLTEIGKPAVEPLIELLNDKKSSPIARNCAAAALGNIGDSTAIEPLINTMTEYDTEFLPAFAVGALSIMCKDKDNEKLITEKLVKLNDEFLIFGYQSLIHIGASGTEEFLSSFLNRNGNISMAENFVESGNDKLAKAGREWADRNGYMLIEIPSFGSENKGWGSGKD